MKITKEDLANVETASPLELFEQGIRAKETRTKHTNTPVCCTTCFSKPYLTKIILI